MKTFRSRTLAVLALSTALAAPALIAPPVLTGAPAMAQVAQDFSELAAKVTPAVVNVAVTVDPSQGDDEETRLQGSPLEEFMRRFEEQQQGSRRGQPPRRPGVQRAQGVGTGFIIDPSGIIVTNNHVAGKASSITVTLADGRKLKAKLLGADEKTDLAVLKIEGDKPFPYVEFGDATKVKVGQAVMAVGNPFGLGGTVTTGIVSARGRDIQTGPFDDYIQTDAAINRGNSGGPLFNMDGKVIGINTAIFSPSGGSIGLGFAIPSSIAQPVVAQLKESGKVSRGLLGVQIQTVSEEIAQALGLKNATGALVSEVQPDSAALKAGVKEGDVIKSVNGTEITGVRELVRAVSAIRPGSDVKLDVWRDGKELSLTAKLGDQSAPSRTAKLDKDKKPDAKSSAQPAYGVSLGRLTPEIRQQLGIKEEIAGALVGQVEPGSPADEQGLRTGDLIVQIGKTPIESPQDAAEKLAEAKKAGKPALLKVYREGTTRFVAMSARA
ncbi:MAG TPA: DegQ family serine endoprotease [Reyranellaceae bacterium]|nr:DegQ family serine endoprotease [Reyranellaceae bacterium]